MRNEVLDSIEKATESSIALLFTDLELAQTMLTRAQQARDANTIQRNLDHVERACSSVRHFMGKLRLTDEEIRGLNERLDALETAVGELRARE